MWRGRPVALKLSSVDEFRLYLQHLDFGGWRPSGMVLHNTASPSLRRWQDYPGEQWLRNLKSYYESLGWNAGPHAFVDGAAIWVMTDFNVRGTHSPSWNGTRLGVEMVADFNVEDDDAGPGLAVKLMTAQLFAVCHEVMGWDPETIKLHKEDPATDHDCPGKDIVKSEFIEIVRQQMSRGGGEHPPSWGDMAQELPLSSTARRGSVNTTVKPSDHLNIRDQPSASSRVVGSLGSGALVAIIGDAKNGTTLWYRVARDGGQPEGWVAARFVTLGSPVPYGEPPADGAPEAQPSPPPPPPAHHEPAEAIALPRQRFTRIFATEFGGGAESGMDSAYGGKVNPRTPQASLPARVPDAYRLVRVWFGSRHVDCYVNDVGPWNTRDPWWNTGGRPLAEEQHRRREAAQNGQVPSQPAGIDLTPGAYDALGIPGPVNTRSAYVDVEFVPNR